LKKGERSRRELRTEILIKARIVRDVITVYVNGVQTLQVTDHTYPDDSPGMKWAFASRKAPAEMMITGLRLLRQ
jgi:hypothetical protein